MQGGLAATPQWQCSRTVAALETDSAALSGVEMANTAVQHSSAMECAMTDISFFRARRGGSSSAHSAELCAHPLPDISTRQMRGPSKFLPLASPPTQLTAHSPHFKGPSHTPTRYLLHTRCLQPPFNLTPISTNPLSSERNPNIRQFSSHSTEGLGNFQARKLAWKRLGKFQ